MSSKYEIVDETTGKKDAATPIFDWGKYVEQDGKIWMPFSAQAHHSFVDGIHMGKLAKHLQDYMDIFCS